MVLYPPTLEPDRTIAFFQDSIGKKISYFLCWEEYVKLPAFFLVDSHELCEAFLERRSLYIAKKTRKVA